MPQALDAELRALRRHGRVGGAGHRDVGREVDLAGREPLRELEAGARRGRIGIDPEVGDAEAVLLAQRLVGRAHRRVVGEPEARPVGVEGRAPQGADLEGLREEHERRRLVGARAGALIGHEGGRAHAAAQNAALARVGLGRPGGARIGGPVGAVRGIRRHRAGGELDRPAGLAAGRAPQARRGAAARPAAPTASFAPSVLSCASIRTASLDRDSS